MKNSSEKQNSVITLIETGDYVCSRKEELNMYKELEKYDKDHTKSSTSNKTRYRVVSDRRSYGVYQDFEYAKQYCGDLALQASCYGSSEDFWIEEEGA